MELIAASGWREFPPRLPEQPIFYPVTNEAYAIQIARDWNVKASGAGFVTRFDVDAIYLSRYVRQKVGGAWHTEYWVRAEDLPEFNSNIVGLIVVTIVDWLLSERESAAFGQNQVLAVSNGRPRRFCSRWPASGRM